MSRSKNMKAVWAFAVLAIIVVIVLVAALMTNGFKNWNPYCWFGHDYDSSGVCSTCGEVEPAADDKEQEPEAMPGDDDTPENSVTPDDDSDVLPGEDVEGGETEGNEQTPVEENNTTNPDEGNEPVDVEGDVNA